MDGGGDGAVDGTCMVAGEQSAGRGRHGRQWVSDPGAGLWCSTVLREGLDPGLDPGRVPLIAALAVLDVAAALGGMNLGIKWPNDILASDDPKSGGRKMAGILAEVVNGAVIVGIGINVDYSAEDIPFPGATSWFAETGQHPDRSELLAGLLGALFDRRAQDPAAVLADYRAACVTIGAEVQVVLPDGQQFTGRGIDVDESGHLIVRSGRTLRTVIAGDVIHATIAP